MNFLNGGMSNITFAQKLTFSYDQWKKKLWFKRTQISWSKNMEHSFFWGKKFRDSCTIQDESWKSTHCPCNLCQSYFHCLSYIKLYTGMGETCDHVVAAMFWVEAAIRTGLTSLSCTSSANEWILWRKDWTHKN